MIHEILIDAHVFKDITEGKKTHVMQKYDDAQYSVGDFLALNEIEDTDPVEYTGRCCLVRVTHICAGVERYLTPGTIVLTIRPCVINWDEFCTLKRDVYTVETYGPGEGAAS